MIDVKYVTFWRSSYFTNRILSRHSFYFKSPNLRTRVVRRQLSLLIKTDQYWIIFQMIYNMSHFGKNYAWLTVECNVIIFWSWKSTKCPRKNWTLCSVNFCHVLKFPKIYRFASNQKIDRIYISSHIITLIRSLVS